MNFSEEKATLISIPSFGLALGVFSLGNLLKEYSPIILIICGIVGLTLISNSLIKFIKYPKRLKIKLKNPIAIGMLGTFPMGLMMFSTYIEPYIPKIAFGLWSCAILIQLSLTIYFTFIILPKLKMKDIYSSILISYVGFSIISITSPYYGLENTLGQFFIRTSMVCMVILYIILMYRYIKIPIPDPIKPIIAILAAPIIVLVGYLTVTQNVNLWIVLPIYLFTSTWYLYILYKIVRYYLDFNWLPNHAAYTFTLVINATAGKLFYNYLLSININLIILQYFATFQLIAAIFIVVLELYKFGEFVFTDKINGFIKIRKN
ncbi:hypothetical protein BGI41_04685 [Methanobrevibacter sp. 87.7]|uniref:SLAC1 family transporter n=1 Tax=Methanobrevibacter sp. 87.7 TaxID=387957 RepID=UPI000B50DF76|nr:hypothetical protein [Methanobrevibacter sp. 87.7]OWT33005.1 hypothetical protein BGI41_04685 [Methanobrevibacter sp. 87.7]